ncbi:uncharacterized protein LOC111247856 isoform X3 [Varroa destructor]|nr:uncharacterized protein LOC111247856 isoform X3 [Varroa destructor]
MSCNATINLTNGLPLDPDCIPVFSAERDIVEASIMSGLPSATHFCGGPRPHDHALPTKQNVMCEGRSTNDIVEQHLDFFGRTYNGLLGRTRFVFVQEQAQVVAFVVQITELTMQHNRRNYILRALNQFLRSEAPGDMQIALVTYGAVASEIALRRAAASDEGVRNAVDALLLLNAEVENGNHVNSTLEDGLRIALMALNDTSEITERVAHNTFTKRVLVIGDGHCSENFSSLLRHSYNAQGVRVDAIIFPSRSFASTSRDPDANRQTPTTATALAVAPASQTDVMTTAVTKPKSTLSVAQPVNNILDEFVSRTNGRIKTVNNTPIDDTVTVSALQELYDALYAFTYLDTSAAHYDSFSCVGQAEFYGKEQNEMVFQFDIDPTLNAELRVRLIGHDYGSDRPWTVSPKDIVLYAPAGHAANGKKVYSPKDYKFVSTNAQFWYYEFKIPEPAVGRWRLEAKTRRDTRQPIIVSAAAKPTTDENNEPIIVDVWISQRSYNVTLWDKGLVVYAKVSKGSRPVVDVTVVARITPVSDETETEVRVELKDNGAGDPDITKDDGIYSRYIEGITKVGRHRLIVEAKSEGSATVLRSTAVPDDVIPHTACCGSMVMRTAQNATRRFSRRVDFGSFFVTSVALGNQQDDKTYSASWTMPARVADLHVAYLQSNPGGSGRISLRWTASGNVRDHGRAASYILKRFDSHDEAIAHFAESGHEIDYWEFDDGLLLPKEAGTLEQVYFELPNDILLPQYFALKVNNTYGVTSAVSNVAMISAMPPAAVTIPSIWGLGGSQDHGGSRGYGDAKGGFAFASDQGLFGQRDGTRFLPNQFALIVTVPLIVLVLGICVIMVVFARRRRDPLLDKVKKATKDDKSNGVNIDTYNTGTIPKNSEGNNMSPLLTPSSIVKEDISPMTSGSRSLPLSPSMDFNNTTVGIDHSFAVSNSNGVPALMNPMTSQQQAGLSPVNHWPADILLEHYDKVQGAKQRNEQPSVLTLQSGHLDETVHSTSHALCNLMDPLRGRASLATNSATSNQMNGSLQHLPVGVTNSIYPPYNSPAIVTPTGVHVNAPSRNITHV